MAPDPNPYAAPAATARTTFGRMEKAVFSGMGLAVALVYLRFALGLGLALRALDVPVVPAMSFALSGGIIIVLLPIAAPWMMPVAFRRLTMTGGLIINLALLLTALAMFAVLDAARIQELPFLNQPRHPYH